jgi:hypothetical protein
MARQCVNVRDYGTCKDALCLVCVAVDSTTPEYSPWDATECCGVPFSAPCHAWCVNADYVPDAAAVRDMAYAS